MPSTSFETYIASFSRRIPHTQSWKRNRFERMQEVLTMLDNPERKIPHYIHITGTSGKGSVAILMSTILKTIGHKTGLLLSPHPSYITERWQINNQPMSQAIFKKIGATIYQAIQKYESSSLAKQLGNISYGELTTIIGLYYFALKKVTWAVIEVGIGGKGDSTSIIPHKDVAIITNIGIDHLKKIGPTKADIARAKLGILKQNVPLFSTESNPDILKLFKKTCLKTKSPLYLISSARISYSKNLDGINFFYQGQNYDIPLLGYHQAKNALLAINVAEYLGISKNIIHKALKSVRLPIRLEVISKNPLIILDSAHNREKLKSTAKTISSLAPSNSLHLLLAISSREDLSMKIKSLHPLCPTTVICTRTPDTLPPHLFSSVVQKNFPQTEIFIEPDYWKAFQSLKRKTKKQDILLITGSVYLAGALRNKLLKNSDN